MSTLTLVHPYTCTPVHLYICTPVHPYTFILYYTCGHLNTCTPVQWYTPVHPYTHTKKIEFFSKKTLSLFAIGP